MSKAGDGEEEAVSNRKQAYASLYIKDFRLFITARFCITLAVQVQTLAVTWQMYAITGSKLSLGLIGLAEALPGIAVALFAGHVADVVPRKKIMQGTVGTLFFCSMALLLFSWKADVTIPMYGVTPIYLVIIVSGVARGFLAPAAFSFMPQLVPRHLFSNAVTLNSSLWQAAAIAGPPLGGIIYGIFDDATVPYLVDASLVAVSFILFTFIPKRALPPTKEEAGQSMFQKITAGLQFVWRNQILLSAITLDLFAVLFGGAVALLPVFTSEILHVGPTILGLLRAAPSAGALVMAFYLTHHPIKKHAGKIMLYSVAGFGVCMILFALSVNVWLSMFVLILSGGFDFVSVIIRSTLLQTLTPENMKGRVSAVNKIFIGSSNGIGGFESGVTAEAMGTVPAVIFGGCMTLLVVAITGWKAKKLRNLQDAG